MIHKYDLKDQQVNRRVQYAMISTSVQVCVVLSESTSWNGRLLEIKHYPIHLVDSVSQLQQVCFVKVQLLLQLYFEKRRLKTPLILGRKSTPLLKILILLNQP